MIRRRRSANSAAPAYPGSGRLSDYREDGSWMMNQIEKGYDKCPRGVRVERDEGGRTRFAGRTGGVAIGLAEAAVAGRTPVRRVADGDGDVTLISSAWCRNRAGVCVSFAVPIMVMDLGEIAEFGRMFKETVEETYGDMLDENFWTKTDDPVICCTHSGELIMLWSFQGEAGSATENALRMSRIERIDYDA